MSNFSSLQFFAALSSIAYEKVCVLFNIAALQSTLAANQSFDNDDGLKTAAKLFQQAAGIFTHLKSAAPALGQETTPDLSVETLHILSLLMVEDNVLLLILAYLA